MDAQKLGRKMREARLTKRLTQSKVAGSFIARSMLSQIESGTATPSMKTLGYLSRVLSVPMGRLVPGDDPIETLTQTKTVLVQGQAERALPLVRSFIYDLHDESSAIAARVHLMLVQQFAQHYEYVSTVTHARLAAKRAQRGVYACTDVRVSALSLLDKIERSQGMPRAVICRPHLLHLWVRFITAAAAPPNFTTVVPVCFFICYNCLTLYAEAELRLAKGTLKHPPQRGPYFVSL